MRLFAFKCPDCGHDFEELVKTDEKAICPGCGSNRGEKQFSGPSLKEVPRYFGNNHDPEFRRMTGADQPVDPYSTM